MGTMQILKNHKKIPQFMSIYSHRKWIIFQKNINSPERLKQSEYSREPKVIESVINSPHPTPNSSRGAQVPLTGKACQPLVKRDHYSQFQRTGGKHFQTPNEVKQNLENETKQGQHNEGGFFFQVNVAQEYNHTNPK